MMRPITELQTTYTGDELAELLETLDMLHSAASDGQLATTTTMTEQELLGMLRDIAFTAQETITEIEKRRKSRTRQPILKLVCAEAEDKLA